jgi:hypothetical protein
LAACAADRDGFALGRVRDGEGDGEREAEDDRAADTEGAAEDVVAAGVVGAWVAGVLPAPYM